MVMNTIPEFNSPEFQHDLHAHYAALREQHPVHRSEFDGHPRYSVLTHDAVQAGLRDPRLLTSGFSPNQIKALNESGRPALAAIAQLERGLLLLKDPPDHTRLRALVSRAFTPRRIARLRQRITQVTDELLDAAEGRGHFDFIEDFAVPLPLIAIADLLGVPVEDRAQFKKWSTDLAKLLDRTQLAAGLLGGAASALEAAEYFRDLFDEKRRAPQDDLMSALVAARDAGDRLDDDELLSTAMLLLGAGHETTTNLLGNGLLCVLRDPAAADSLRTRPELAESAVEELLRFESPIQRTVRRPAEAVEICGRRIPEGAIVDLVLSAANRDPARFAEPDRLDLERADNRHLAFGGGIHFCPGAALARLEAQIALPAVLQRFPGLKLAENEAHWRAGSLLRGVQTLPLSF